MKSLTLDQRIEKLFHQLSAAERRVAEVFRGRQEEVLLSTASALAALAYTSDATVVRTARSLGYSGLEELRRRLSTELGRTLTPASRLAGTLRSSGSDFGTALTLTLETHLSAINFLRTTVTAPQVKAIVEHMVDAPRTVVFGLGPSSAIANYLCIQLRRFGLTSLGLSNTGLLFADDLHTLRSGDFVVMLAYTRIYPELAALIDEVKRLELKSAMITDALGKQLAGKISYILTVARGRANMFSMHTATFALIEALLVGVAMTRPDQSVEALDSLNRLRGRIAGDMMELPAGNAGPGANRDDGSTA